MIELKAGLGRIAKAMDLQFTLNGQPVSYDEVFSDIGMLPALAKRADQLCSLCLGYGLGVTFPESEGSRLGIKSVFDEDTPAVLRYVCITDILYELMNAASYKGQVPLDDLLYD